MSFQTSAATSEEVLSNCEKRCWWGKALRVLLMRAQEGNAPNRHRAAPHYRRLCEARLPLEDLRAMLRRVLQWAAVGCYPAALLAGGGMVPPITTASLPMGWLQESKASSKWEASLQREA